ncbi:hypothetical protein GCM10022252_76490 [Streptosporangium oxazolinicum]|uniref:IrrE N-terminal-like domain-containing protein n=1 Tax=Streptosporangium oxazolinicum TaxID=909287 RepID=A0ABP8BLA5_9ACTN
MPRRFTVPAPVRAALDAVRAPRPFDVGVYLARVEEVRGHPIVLHEDNLPLTVCGLWRFDGRTDHIHVPRGTTGVHRWQIIGHEVGHLLMSSPAETFGHGLGAETQSALSQDMQSTLTGLFPDLDPEMVARYMARSQYEVEEERHAELYATLAIAGDQAAEPEGGRIGRIRQAMDGLR